ncbi:MAG: diguanylate cyclase [Syntrophales bacterium]|nr:diguanylate cyclase [Syntrophales bacterium]
MICFTIVAGFTLIAGSYAIFRLKDMSELASSVISKDYEALENSRKMADLALGMENVEKKFLVMKDDSIAALFWLYSSELQRMIDSVADLKLPGFSYYLEKVMLAKSEYEELFRQKVSLINEGRLGEATRLSEDKGKHFFESLLSSIKALQRKAEQTVDARIKEINRESVKASRITMLLTISGLFLGLFLAVRVTLDISKPLSRLEKMTSLIAQGNFNEKINLSRNDEIGSLSKAFDAMVEKLKVLEAMLLDASPLTGLPGNRAIEEEISKRLHGGIPFSLCHIDLDNFKPYGDNYGYAWGSEVIREVALILEEAKKKMGGQLTFIGHIGGDDFVLLDEPERARTMALWIIQEFDRRSLKFYTEEDRKSGGIWGRDRKGNVLFFPLISLTISIVTDDGRMYKNPIEMARAVAQVKNYGKTLPGSKVVSAEDIAL